MEVQTASLQKTARPEVLSCVFPVAFCLFVLHRFPKPQSPQGHDARPGTTCKRSGLRPRRGTPSRGNPLSGVRARPRPCRKLPSLSPGLSKPSICPRGRRRAALRPSVLNPFLPIARLSVPCFTPSPLVHTQVGDGAGPKTPFFPPHPSVTIWLAKF